MNNKLGNGDTIEVITDEPTISEIHIQRGDVGVKIIINDEGIIVDIFSDEDEVEAATWATWGELILPTA